MINLKTNLLNLFKNKTVSESQYILGIDLGDSASSICYYDTGRKTSEIIDISGGYGRANMPTTLQYTMDSGEWVFGENAVLNDQSGEDISFNNILNNLGNNSHTQVGETLRPNTYILGLYIKELVRGLKNINPKAEIIGIIVSVPDYIQDSALQELSEAFAEAGCEDKLIGFVPQRECALSFHFHERKADKENLLLVDFGGRELRAGIYEVSGGKELIKADMLSYFFDKQLSAGAVDEQIKDKFAQIYEKNTGETVERAAAQINTLFYQNKDILFQRNITAKGVRVYYNFVHPPFGHVFSKDEIKGIIEPFRTGTVSFFESLFKRSKKAIEFGDISAVLCTGGGFEMLWSRELMEDLFPDSNIFIHKSPKAVNAYGAAIIAAAKLGLETGKAVEIEDSLKTKKDIGIVIEVEGKKEFLPISRRGNLWWQAGNTLKFAVRDIGEECSVKLHQRDSEEYMSDIGCVPLKGLPLSTEVTYISIALCYVDSETLKVRVEDKGFGKFFSESGAYGEELFKIG